ncbi:MAG: hypothetical protein AAFR55_03955 [Pseudomonadota bacterium]
MAQQGTFGRRGAQPMSSASKATHVRAKIVVVMLQHEPINRCLFTLATGCCAPSHLNTSAKQQTKVSQKGGALQSDFGAWTQVKSYSAYIVHGMKMAFKGK